MLGPTHALSGAAAFLALAPAVSHLAHCPLDPATLAAGAMVCAGAALAPDLDHEHGTLSHALGPISDLVTRIVAKVSGGHRHATHSLLFAAAAGFGTWALVAQVGRPAMLALCLALTAAALRALEVPVVGRHWLWCWAGAAAIAYMAGRLLPGAWPGAWSWLPWTVGLGCLVHLAGDLLTPRGVPLLWPIPLRLEVPLIDIDTASWRETWVIAPGLVATVLILAVVRL